MNYHLIFLKSRVARNIYDPERFGYQFRILEQFPGTQQWEYYLNYKTETLFCIECCRRAQLCEAWIKHNDDNICLGLFWSEQEETFKICGCDKKLCINDKHDQCQRCQVPMCHGVTSKRLIGDRVFSKDRLLRNCGPNCCRECGADGCIKCIYDDGICTAEFRNKCISRQEAAVMEKRRKRSREAANLDYNHEDYWEENSLGSEVPRVPPGKRRKIDASFVDSTYNCTIQ